MKNTVRASALILLLSSLVVSTTAWNLQGGTVRPQPVPTVTFTRSLSSADPIFYSFVINPMGSASYTSFLNSDQGTRTRYTLKFTASHHASDRVFGLIRELNFLRGGYSVTQALNPTKVSNSLTYSAGLAQHRIIYTATSDQRIRELTSFFERLSATVNYRRTLEANRQNPSRLASELKEVQSQRRRGSLVEFEVISPVLQQIASDTNLPRSTRQLARSILHEMRAS